MSLTRPAWWPKHVPARCPACRSPLLPGRVSISWAHCACPGAGAAHGHNVWYCGQNGCHWHVWPPEHVPGSETPELPRSYG